VHGITLGFGVTLIGEAVDYSIYLFIQGRGNPREDWRRTVWPTIRLGVLTSIAGFGALLPSNFQGLAQLGLYSIAGLVAAALVTRYILPGWVPPRLTIDHLAAPGTILEHSLAGLRRWRALLVLVPLLAAAGLYLHRGALLNHELAALSPVPRAQQDLDARLRADLGAPDVRYMVVTSAHTQEAALEAAERLAARLAPLVDDGTIAGFESASRYLPSARVQRERLQALPAAASLEGRLDEAVAGLPVRAQTLRPFLAAVEQARGAPLMTGADLEGTSFAAAADTLLVRTQEGYAALLPVMAESGDLSDKAVVAVQRAVHSAGGHALLLDLKGETDRLYVNYLRQAIELSLAGAGVIVLLLIAALRSAPRVARVLTPLALAVIAVAGLLTAFGQKLTILHLVGMLLLVAVGSNYALFFDRTSHDMQQGSVRLTLASLLVANLATVLAFGVLAFSRVPVLADLGSTVAPGALLALLFSAMLSAPTTHPQLAA
jgi:predicted exporter